MTPVAMFTRASLLIALSLAVSVAIGCTPRDASPRPAPATSPTAIPFATGSPAPTEPLPTITPQPAEPWLTFIVTVPANTPVEDTVFLQSGPFVALPMEPDGANRWKLTVRDRDLLDPFGRNGPDSRVASYLQHTGLVEYAYTRGQGYLAAESLADNPSGDVFWARVRSATLSPDGGVIEDEVDRWRWFPSDADTASVLVPYEPRLTEWAPRLDGHEFQAGYMVADLWNDELPPVVHSTNEAASASGANWIGVAPPWDYSGTFPEPVIAPDKSLVPAYSNEELRQHLLEIEEDGLNVLLTPQICCVNLHPDTPRPEGWNEQWFDQYENFLLTHAEIAEETGVDAFLVSYDMAKAIHDGTEEDEANDARFREIIGKVRDVYHGPVGIAVLAGWGYENYEEIWPWDVHRKFADEFDFIGVALWQALADSNETTPERLTEDVETLFQQILDPLYEETGLPLVFYSVAYGSFDGGAQNQSNVFDVAGAVYAPEPQLQAESDLEEQAMVFDAIMAAVAARPFVTGFYPFLYHYNALPLAPDYSVRGKPAEDVIAAWYELAAAAWD